MGNFEYTDPNYILRFGSVFFSYNDDPSGGQLSWANQLNSCETAFVAGGEYYIVCGDLRGELENCTSLNDAIDIIYDCNFEISKRSTMHVDNLLSYKQ